MAFFIFYNLFKNYDLVKVGFFNERFIIRYSPANSTKEDIIATLKQHPEIKFVSLVGIDLAGNDTDEKIPMRIFLEDIDAFL